MKTLQYLNSWKSSAGVVDGKLQSLIRATVSRNAIYNCKNIFLKICTPPPLCKYSWLHFFTFLVWLCVLGGFGKEVSSWKSKNNIKGFKGMLSRLCTASSGWNTREIWNIFIEILTEKQEINQNRPLQQTALHFPLARQWFAKGIRTFHVGMTYVLADLTSPAPPLLRLRRLPRNDTGWLSWERDTTEGRHREKSSATPGDAIYR